jgi:hypothetical protein
MASLRLETSLFGERILISDDDILLSSEINPWLCIAAIYKLYFDHISGSHETETIHVLVEGLHAFTHDSYTHAGKKSL